LIDVLSRLPHAVLAVDGGGGLQQLGTPLHRARQVITVQEYALDTRSVDLGAGGLAVRDGAHALLGTDVSAAAGAAQVAITVDEGVKVQELTAAIDGLLAAGVKTFELRDWRRGDAAGAKIRLGKPSGSGVDVAVVRAAVRARKADLQACYDAALATRPDLQGTATATFFVTPEGKVTQVDVSGLDPDVDACLEPIIASLELPAPTGGGGASVSYPMTFSPR
jgi:hypothetical protein